MRDKKKVFLRQKDQGIRQIRWSWTAWNGRILDRKFVSRRVISRAEYIKKNCKFLFWNS